MLPEPLIFLLAAATVYAQARPNLELNRVTSLNIQRLPQPPSFAIPPQQNLSISVALCSDSTPFPRFFVSNVSNGDSQDDPGPSGGPNVFEILLDRGQGNWTGTFVNGGILAVNSNGANGLPFELAITDRDAPLHEITRDLPFFGDTTSNQALLFSPILQTIAKQNLTYPNYTLPAANMAQPTQPTNSSNLTVILSLTSSGLANKIQTGCFLSSQQPLGTLENETFWARDEQSWRTQWLMGGLTPSTNYTAYVLQNSTKVSGPIFFSTKSASFNCPLVHSLPYCPGVAYSVPLPAPPSPAIAYDSTNLPTEVTTPLLAYMANFTTTLTTFACGRDWYSPIVGCDDCQREYRKWLCSISFTRCGEPSPENPNGFTATPAEPSATGLSATKQTDAAGAQRVLSALQPQETRNPPRNPFLPQLGSRYNMLLPCLEQCNQVDRACPPFLQFKCPTNDFNGAASYGIGYIDSANGDQNGGLTGVAQDRWGNVWCNLI